MAVQPTNRRPVDDPIAGKILKTPAPDAVDNIRAPTGVGQGQNGPQNRSWCAPGHAVESILASNLRQSQADSEDVLSKVIAGGVAGRDDHIPATGANDWQRRVIDDTPYAPAHGHARRGADSGSPGGSVPQTIGGTPVKAPNLKP